MSQINLTYQERIEALVRVGYTQREADFLGLAALNGGFFLRRQYCQFLGMGTGGTAAALIEKVLAKRHAVTIAGPHNSRIYHLSARPFYAALGQEDNRNRRERPLVAMKNRLMGLDFVLEHPSHRYLPTEQGKVTFFYERLGINADDLPKKTFRSPDAQESTTRYFVDKYPLFVEEEPAQPASVSFCFVDEGTVTTARFQSHLNQYVRLFARLHRFEMVYVASCKEAFGPAQKAFQNFVRGRSQPHPDRLTIGEVSRLAEYFKLRKLYENAQLDSFDRETLIRFRNDREEFSLPVFQALYVRWTSIGEHAFEEALGRTSPVIDPSCASFSTCFLEHNYDLFGA